MKFASIILLGVLCAAPATAQQVGEYTGAMWDGSSVTIDVGTDPNTGKLEVTTIGFGVSDICQSSKEMLFYVGVGLGDGHDISSKGKLFYASGEFFEIDLVTNMTFKGTESVSGKGAAYLAAFNPAIGHEKLTTKTQACVSPNQSFRATFSGTGVSHALPAGTVVVHRADGTSTMRQGN
ncbi:MAG TPA: hypothetical protein VHZ29_13760 [Rhizomicrobium sp.]|nr:hypothetical protein [Rhizomicrobium sp.]